MHIGRVKGTAAASEGGRLRERCAGSYRTETVCDVNHAAAAAAAAAAAGPRGTRSTLDRI